MCCYVFDKNIEQCISYHYIKAVYGHELSGIESVTNNECCIGVVVGTSMRYHSDSNERHTR